MLARFPRVIVLLSSLSGYRFVAHRWASLRVIFPLRLLGASSSDRHVCFSRLLLPVACRSLVRLSRLRLLHLIAVVADLHQFCASSSDRYACFFRLCSFHFSLFFHAAWQGDIRLRSTVAPTCTFVFQRSSLSRNFASAFRFLLCSVYLRSTSRRSFALSRRFLLRSVWVVVVAVLALPCSACVCYAARVCQ